MARKLQLSTSGLRPSQHTPLILAGVWAVSLIAEEIPNVAQDIPPHQGFTRCLDTSCPVS